MLFGDLLVRNLRVDAAADPVFTITHMVTLVFSIYIDLAV